MQEEIKTYFHFTKKERIGIISLLAITICIALLPQLYSKITTAASPPNFDTALAALSLKENDTTFNDFKKYDTEKDYGNKYKFDKENLEAALFNFDPNTIDSATWQSLGTKAKTASSIQKYIVKGGKFWKPEDIFKVWGMSDALKQRLVGYIKIPPRESNYVKKEFTPYEKKVYEKKQIAAVEINAADSAALESLPGIGGGFARRILAFRNKLGGFYNINQVAETFGMQDSTFQKVKPFLNCNPSLITKININTATADELKNHPYLKWQLANIIVNYRKQHGNYKAVEDLKKIMTIDEETYNKIAPYFTL
jgi:competence protein ComEA